MLAQVKPNSDLSASIFNSGGFSSLTALFSLQLRVSGIYLPSILILVVFAKHCHWWGILSMSEPLHLPRR